MVYFSATELVAGSVFFLQVTAQVLAPTATNTAGFGPTGAEAQAAWTGAPKTAPEWNGQWSGHGANLYNNRWAIEDEGINSTTISGLVQNCQHSYPLGVCATPVVLNDTVYFPTSNGSFYAMNYATCEIIWESNIAQIIFDVQVPSPVVAANALPISRTSPQIDNGIVYLGTQSGALLVALDLATGKLLGRIKVNPHELAIVTMSPTVYQGIVFVGASSQEESATLNTSYPCCTFIGNFGAFKFDSTTGQFTQLWNVQTLPPNAGWSGASVWSSQPSIDPVRQQVFIATGNTYIYPPQYEICLKAGADCLPDDVWQESVIAIDIPTGKPNWRKSISGLDGWVLACGDASSNYTLNATLCPVAPGPDNDFAMAPTFVPAALGAGTTGNDSLVIGQKNGDLYSFNAVTGDIQWLVNPGNNNDAGGMSWGIAVDDTKAYFTGINYGQKQVTLKPSGTQISNSFWGAVSLKNGEVVWMTAVPDNMRAYSPPGLIGDLVFVGQAGSTSQNISGSVVALDRGTGEVVGSLGVNTVQDSGISAHNGFIFFGTGYQYRNPFEYGSINVYGLPSAIAAGKARASVLIAAAASSSAASSAAASGTGSAHTGSAPERAVDSGLIAIYPILLFLAGSFTLLW